MRQGAGAGLRPILALLLTSVIAGVGLLPGAAAAAEVRTFGFDGDGAEAVFESFEGCAKRTAIVRPLHVTSRENGTGATEGSSVLVHLLRSDPCADTFDSRIGRVDLAATAFRVRGDLGYASLRAKVDLRDWLTGQTVPLDLDLTWRPDGDALRYGERSRTRYPDGSMWITRNRGIIRDAVATGRLSDGTYDYAAGSASTSANMSTAKLGFVSVTVPR